MRGHGEKPQIIVKLAVGRPESGRKNMKKIGNQDTFVRDAVHGYTTSFYFVATLRALFRKKSVAWMDEVLLTTRVPLVVQ